MRPERFAPALVFAAMVLCAGSAAAQTTPFRLIDNRIFIPVRLNGQGPFPFILDTGSTAAVSDRVAAQLDLKVSDAGEGEGVGATRPHVGDAHIADVAAGPLHLRDVDFAVMSLADTPQVFGNEPYVGVIGDEVFTRMVVKIDYANRRLTFVPPDAFHYEGRGTILPITRPDQIPVVAATLDGIAGHFGVDTGARSALLLYGPFCAQNHLAEKYGATLEGVTGWGFGGPVRSLLARAGTLQLGDVAVHGPVIRLSTQKGGLTTSNAIAGLIGPDVLGQFDVTFDYSHNRMILEKGSDFGRRDSYDRAGVWMGQHGAHFAAVDVIKGGPGYAAGVRTGDIILAIDGKDTSGLVLPDVRERMRRLAPGTKVTLLLQAGARTVTVTLRDLV